MMLLWLLWWLLLILRVCRLALRVRWRLLGVLLHWGWLLQWLVRRRLLMLRIPASLGWRRWLWWSTLRLY